jgi:hypothetical protein
MKAINRLNKAFNKMDMYIYPSPSLFRRIVILLDIKLMNILYGYNTNDYYLYEFYRLKLFARKSFIGQDNGQKKISLVLNDYNDMIIFQKKNIFYKAFAKYLCRDWLLLNQSTFNDYRNFCAIHSDFLKKPIDQYGGIGIEKFNVTMNTNQFELYSKLKSENCLIEEIILQDKAISSFNPSSVNTIRIYSIFNNSKIVITTAFLRMGVGDVIVDNFSNGGIAAKIDIDTGIITTPAKNKSGKSFILHPFTNKQIIGFKIPRWIDIKKLIEEAALVVPKVRYVAWDIVINTKGEICLIEGNELGGFNIQESIDLQGKKTMYSSLLNEICK